MPSYHLAAYKNPKRLFWRFYFVVFKILCHLITQRFHLKLLSGTPIQMSHFNSLEVTHIHPTQVFPCKAPSILAFLHCPTSIDLIPVSLARSCQGQRS